MESSPRSRRGVRALCGSAVLHAGLIACAVALTAHPRASRRPHERVAIVSLQPPVASTTPVAPTARPRGFQVLTTPLRLPTTIPDVDVTRPVTKAEDFSGMGVAGGLASGIAPAALPFAALSRTDPIDAQLADEQPYLVPNQMGPEYPEPLRYGAPDGVVIVRFVLDTLGRAEPASLSVVQASHPLFAASVRTSLDHLRFVPARLLGQRVRARVEERFEFHLAAR